MRRRRQLKVGADGMAEVTVLGDPVPRHLSIVSWGANDRPAQSWMSALPPEQQLREPPTVVEMDAAAIDLAGIKGFIDETMSAWRTTMVAVLDHPLSSEERGARVRALTSQAGARVAALAAAATSGIARAAKSYKSVTIEVFAAPTESTLQGEIDRRHFLAGVDGNSAYLVNAAITSMREITDGSMTEAILGHFGEIANVMAAWAESLPAGVVGVAAKPVAASAMAGARHSQIDLAKLEIIKTLIGDLTSVPAEPPAPTPPTPAETTERAMIITLKDLQACADADPVGFVALCQKAFTAAQAKAPAGTLKFMFGETGVDQYDPTAILNALRGMNPGDGLLALIAGAIGGVDINSLAANGGTQVAASMKSVTTVPTALEIGGSLRAGFARVVAAEIKHNPTGEVAAAVRELVAPSVASAISGTLKAFLDGGSQPTNPAGFGGFDGAFPIPENEDPLEVAMPQLNRMVNGG